MNLKPRPAYCCGKCPETSNGVDCTCWKNPRCRNYAPDWTALMDAIDRLTDTIEDLIIAIGPNVNQVATSTSDVKNGAESLHVCLDCQCGDHCGGYNSVSMGSSPGVVICGRCQCEECEGSK